jgi:IS30 family transposase
MNKQLTSEQRYYIYLRKQAGSTQKSIAEAIGVSESTICRELQRNSEPNGGYNFMRSHSKAMGRRKSKPGNRSKPPELIWRVKQMIIEEQWSPAQISGYLKKEGIQISHETIYKIIRSDASGKLAAHCRHKMKYKKRKTTIRETKATNIKNRVSIHERPAEADGNRFGDWEMDLIVDQNQNAILTMVERSTDYLIMEKLRYGKRAMPLAKVVWRLLMPFRGDKLLTITTDNGSEFAAHEWISKKLGVDIYFTDSYASWQKGNIENTNKLIRQYIPKGTDFKNINNNRIMQIQKKINRRPREKLGFNSPKYEFYKHFL